MNIKESVKIAVKSRAFLALWLLTFLQTLLLVVVVFAFSHSNELQVPVHYSAFSSIQFYRDQWYYLLIFAAFAVVVFGTNSLIGLKLFSEKGRSLALGFMLITVAVLAISSMLILALLRVTSLLQ